MGEADLKNEAAAKNFVQGKFGPQLLQALVSKDVPLAWAMISHMMDEY